MTYHQPGMLGSLPDDVGGLGVSSLEAMGLRHFNRLTTACSLTIIFKDSGINTHVGPLEAA